MLRTYLLWFTLILTLLNNSYIKLINSANSPLCLCMHFTLDFLLPSFQSKCMASCLQHQSIFLISYSLNSLTPNHFCKLPLLLCPEHFWDYNSNYIRGRTQNRKVPALKYLLVYLLELPWEGELDILSLDFLIY